MTRGDKLALEALNSRFDHTAAIARLVCDHAELPADIADALRGIAETLDELAKRMDDVLHVAAVGVA